MEADYDSFEIACVIGGYKLVDAESYERCYQRWDGRPLVPGYYVVHWPAGIRIRRFDEHALFHGPYRLRLEARAALERLRAVPEADESFLLRWLISPHPHIEAHPARRELPADTVEVGYG